MLTATNNQMQHSFRHPAPAHPGLTSPHLPIYQSFPGTIQRPKNQSENLPTPKVYNQRTFSIIYYPRKLKFEHPISKVGTQSELKSKIRFKLKFKIKLKPKFRLELQANNQDLQYTSLQSSKQRMSNCLSIFVFYATSRVSQITEFKDEQPLWHFLFSEQPTTFSQIL